MWFSRKSKNRRFGQKNILLDVKLRAEQVRATRMRWGAIALVVSGGTILSLFLLWRAGEWALNRFIYENREFAVQQIDVETDGVIAPEQLRRWAGVKPGVNLFALDLARVKRDLELVPAVKSAAVERVLPRTLRIRVDEREPVAQAYAPQPRAQGGYDMKMLQLDADGCVMLPLGPLQRSTPLSQVPDLLPTISGIDPTSLAPGRQLDSPQARAALELIVAFERSPMAGLADLRRVDVASSVLLVTTGQGSVVTFALGDFDKQLRRWREIFDRGQKMNQTIASVDLAVPNNIPVRWVEINPTQPGQPISPTPKPKFPTNRRRNV
ncbi:MAG: cell division protein FtsQ [Verrucomicrobiota bacterium]